MDGKRLNITEFMDREALQTHLDNAAEENNLGIIVLAPQLEPLTRPSIPSTSIYQRFVKNQPLQNIIFRIEKNSLAVSGHIIGPLYSSFLSGRLVRAIIPIFINETVAGYLCTIRIIGEELPYHPFLELLASSPTEKGMDVTIESLMDTIPFTPTPQFSEQLESLAQEVSSFFERAFSLSAQSRPEESDSELLDSGSDLLIFTDASGDIVHLTEPIVTLLGYESREELKGRHIYEILRLGVLESEPAEARGVWAPTKSEKCAVALHHRSGKVLYGDLVISSYRPGNRETSPLMFQWQIEPLQTPPDSFRELAETRREKLFGPWPADSTTFSPASVERAETVADATDKQNSRKWPLGAASALTQILDSYPLPLLMVNEREELIYWNGRAEHLFGLQDMSDPITFSDLLKETDQDKWQQQKSSILKSDLDTKRPQTWFASCKTLKDDTFSATLRLYKTELEGSPFLTITVEEIDHAIAGSKHPDPGEAESAAILLTDGGGNILSANRQAWHLLSWRDEIVGTSLADLVDKKDRHGLNNFFIKLYGKERAEHKVRLAGTHKEYTLFAEKLSFGSKGEYYLLLRLGGEKKASSHDRAAGDRSTETGGLFPLFSELLGQISFRLFEGLSTLQDELLVEPEQETLLRQLETLAEQASNIGEKLGFIYNRKKPQFKPHNLNLLLEDLYKTIRTEFRNPIKLELNKVPPIHTDQEEVWFVVQALLQNADEATEKKHSIDISTFTKVAGEQEQCFRAEDWGKEFVCCKISDRGKGIPPHIQNRLYDPFVTDKEDGFGRGFSLACVRAILDRCGGYIEYDTEINKGTSFYVYLPAVTQGIHSTVGKPVLDPDRNTILAVDDESALLDLYRTTLEKEYNVICASNGEEAIQLMREHKLWINLCIVDVNLPDSSMINCPTELLKIKPDIPFIIATGESNNGSLDHFLSQARSFWLHKPFPPSTLQRAVQRLLKVYRQSGDT